MKILYAPNPLCTQVLLDENEQHMLWYKIKVDEMHNLLSQAEFYLEESYLDLERARKTVDSAYYESEDDNTPSRLDQRVNQLHSMALIDLQNAHFGDCVAVACSCSKCYAENLLNVNTIPYASKYILSTIRDVFKTPETTLEDAIEQLSQWTLNLTPEEEKSWAAHGGYAQHIDRWKAQRQQAHDWLQRYRDEHFSHNKTLTSE